MIGINLPQNSFRNRRSSLNARCNYGPFKNWFVTFSIASNNLAGVAVRDGDIMYRLDAAGGLYRLDRQPTGDFKAEVVAGALLSSIQSRRFDISPTGCQG